MCIRYAAQVISLEGWTDIMYYVQDAHSFWDWVYFVLLIVVSRSILICTHTHIKVYMDVNSTYILRWVCREAIDRAGSNNKRADSRRFLPYVS